MVRTKQTARMSTGGKTPRRVPTAEEEKVRASLAGVKNGTAAAAVAVVVNERPVHFGLFRSDSCKAGASGTMVYRVCTLVRPLAYDLGPNGTLPVGYTFLRVVVDATAQCMAFTTESESLCVVRVEIANYASAMVLHATGSTLDRANSFAWACMQSMRVRQSLVHPSACAPASSSPYASASASVPRKRPACGQLIQPPPKQAKLKSTAL